MLFLPMILLNHFSSSIKTNKKELHIYHTSSPQEPAAIKDLLLKLLLQLYHEEGTHAHVKKMFLMSLGDNVNPAFESEFYINRK